MKNPFELNFGLEPSNYISRLSQSAEIISSFEQHAGSRVYMITGMRGTGKTVLLSNISNYFEQKEGWIVLSLISSMDMLEQWSSALYNESLFRRIFGGKNIGFSFNGFSFSFSGEKPTDNAIGLLEALLKKIDKAGKRVLLCVDEVVKNEYVKPFVQVFQVLQTKKLPIFLLMTGLFQNLYGLQNDKSLTFLYRTPKIVLEPLSINSIARSYAKLLNIDAPKALGFARQTKGYAYAYQVLGFLLYKTKEKELTSDVLADFDQYLYEFVYEKTWSELSPEDQNVLKAFHAEEEEVSNLLERTGMEKGKMSVYRDRLIKRGILFPKARGVLRLTLPRFIEFIQSYEE